MVVKRGKKTTNGKIVGGTNGVIQRGVERGNGIGDLSYGQQEVSPVWKKGNLRRKKKKNLLGINNPPGSGGRGNSYKPRKVTTGALRLSGIG